ncbi:MAG: hypothetical protein WD534_14080 [Phycisphaeraceae bacterium]
MIEQRFTPPLLCAVMLLACGTLLGGCQSAQEPARVSAMSTSHTAALDAPQVVRIMRYAGFSDEQILDLGTDVRNAVAQAGGANIRIGERTEALLAVEGQTLHVSSRSGGTQLINLQTGRIVDGATAEKPDAGISQP